ncbi:MAG TPA: hypothetical protein VGQ11_01740 [Candidatus Acidoferrales bacterium]|nr:hypothetical protein [Candidatus Acidoferrales bacterium]
MTHRSRARLFRFLVLGFLLTATVSQAQEHPPICEQISKAYGIDSFHQLDQIRFTFNADGAIKVSRSWIWEPKTDRVSYDGPDKAGKPVKVSYFRSQINTQPAIVKEQIDPAFINDKYWLLFPLQLSWDASAKVEDKGLHKLPMGKGSARRVVVTYPASGGYTPGDSYELFVGADNRIREWIFHRGGSASPTLMTSWADYKKAGPLLISLDHRGNYKGKQTRIFFTEVAVKMAGSSTWTSAQ